ncbi:MAG: hypothetical protein OXT09_05605 [Myxococcales bacterium]|nr:hypothetical protein [Myxococcales bacterium]
MTVSVCAAARLAGGWLALIHISGCYLTPTPELEPQEPTPVAMEGETLDNTLESIQEHVFTPACAGSGCHDEDTMAGMLDLSSAEVSYDSLVGPDGEGVPAANRVAAENRWLRVKPGDPNLSFIYRKLELPGLGEGAPMPIGPFQLTEPYMHQLHVWIEEGAER